MGTGYTSWRVQIGRGGMYLPYAGGGSRGNCSSTVVEVRSGLVLMRWDPEPWALLQPRWACGVGWGNCAHGQGSTVQLRGGERGSKAVGDVSTSFRTEHPTFLSCLPPTPATTSTTPSPPSKPSHPPSTPRARATSQHADAPDQTSMWSQLVRLGQEGFRLCSRQVRRCHPSPGL